MSFYSRTSEPSENVHYNYTVNLRLAPVECGIKCCNPRGDINRFNHLNAFNNYFGHLLPEYDGFSLPDVWDGYYHITLAKFWLKYGFDLDSRESWLRNYIENSSPPEQHYDTGFPCKFKTTELKVYSGQYRHAEAEGIEFVTLKVESLNNTLEKLYPLVEIIRKGVRKAGGEWQFKSFADYLNELHVTVRKYKEENTNWSSEFIQKCGIVERVQQNPLEFECIALDITQTRRQARRRNSRWWLGVTGIPLQCNKCGNFFPNDSPGFCSNCGYNGGGYKCSGCKRLVKRKWPGYCDQCKNYERLKPLWSTETKEKKIFEQ
jgi:hypothetical protein